MNGARDNACISPKSPGMSVHNIPRDYDGFQCAVNNPTDGSPEIIIKDFTGSQLPEKYPGSA
jgi:hypothetical protein